MKGLIFSDSMIIAFLEGRKTVTRRLVKLNFKPSRCYSANLESPPLWWDFYDEDGTIKRIKSPYRTGETVYIKETWTIHLCAGREVEQIHYRADGLSCPIEGEKLKWKSSRYMPEWASRCHARIKHVRPPERIQEITRLEAVKEGCPIREDIIAMDVLKWFISLWEILHPRSWDRNDWVWPIELEKI